MGTLSSCAHFSKPKSSLEDEDELYTKNWRVINGVVIKYLKISIILMTEMMNTSRKWWVSYQGLAIKSLINGGDLCGLAGTRPTLPNGFITASGRRSRCLLMMMIMVMMMMRRK